MNASGSRSRWLGPSPRLPARRIASLVPSLTEAVFVLGGGNLLVARTDWCVSPAEGVAGIEIVGGTKNPDVARLLEIGPDVVLANREENTRRRVEALAEHLPVCLTDPRGPDDVPALWEELGAVTGATDAGTAHAGEVRSELAAARAAAGDGSPLHFVYWVWKDPWMAAGHDTYISRLLEAAGLVNALPSAATRFPRVDPHAVEGRVAHLLSSEPYGFVLPRDAEALGPVVSREGSGCHLTGGSVVLTVDGQLYGWYPGRTAGALRAAVSLRLELTEQREGPCESTR